MLLVMYRGLLCDGHEFFRPDLADLALDGAEADSALGGDRGGGIGLDELLLVLGVDDLLGAVLQRGCVCNFGRSLRGLAGRARRIVLLLGRLHSINLGRGHS